MTVRQASTSALVLVASEAGAPLLLVGRLRALARHDCHSFHDIGSKGGSSCPFWIASNMALASASHGNSPDTSPGSAGSPELAMPNA